MTNQQLHARSHPAQRPDRLVAFLSLLEQRLTSEGDGGEGARLFIETTVEEATTANLFDGSIPTLPEAVEGEPVTDEYRACLPQLWGYALTGAHANLRAHVSSLHEGQVDELEEAARRVAEGTAEREGGR